jgi:drug/metabolite transporter (DMT)-like permease
MFRLSVAPRDLVALALAAACWGLGTVASKAALAEMPPLTLLAVQLAASLIILGLLLRLRGISPRGEGSTLLGRLGLLNPGLAYALGLLGLVTIPASLSVLLWALEPLMIVVLAAVVLRERITPTLAVGSLVAVAGTALVVYDPTSPGQLIGAAITIAGIACCAVYTIAVRSWIPDAPETGPVVLAQQAHALGLALVLVVAVGVAGGAVVPASVTIAGLASAVGSGALYYAFAYWFYLGALRHVPASLAAVSFYLIPIAGIAGAAIFLGERLEGRQWIGSIVVLVAVIGVTARLTVGRAADVRHAMIGR